MMEKFSLKWNDFHSNVSKSFRLFRSEEYLHDVRLMTEDYHEVSAHRLVLSACSKYFRNIFKNSKKQDTLICLDGINSADLQNVFDYIYLGEAHICQDKLDRFLNVAERLKLEGLIPIITQSGLESKEEKEVEEGEESKYEGEPEPGEQTIEYNGKESNRAATIRFHESCVPQDSSDKFSNSGMADIMMISEIDLKIKKYGEILENGNRRCTHCDKVVIGNKTNFRNHVERYHMEGLSYDCSQCDKTFSSRGTLSNHKNRNHKPISSEL